MTRSIQVDLVCHTCQVVVRCIIIVSVGNNPLTRTLFEQLQPVADSLGGSRCHRHLTVQNIYTLYLVIRLCQTDVFHYLIQTC